jgi:hypothetical protein
MASAQLVGEGLETLNEHLKSHCAVEVYSNSSQTKLFANFLEKAQVRQVRTFFVSSQTVRGVCLPIIQLHNKHKPKKKRFMQNTAFYTFISQAHLKCVCVNVYFRRRC